MSTTTTHSLRQFSISFALVVLTAISIWFAIGTALKFSLAVLVGSAVILAIRPVLIFRPRRFALSVPLMAILLVTPVFMNWGTIHSAWHSTKRPDPLSDWILWMVVYALPPLSVWAIDMGNEYNTSKRQVFRLVGDVLFLILWAYICVALLQGDMTYHHT